MGPITLTLIQSPQKASKKKASKKKKKRHWELQIGGTTLRRTKYQLSPAAGGRQHITFKSHNADLQTSKFSEISPKIVSIRVDYTVSWAPVKSLVIHQPSAGKFAISYEFALAWANWKQPWTIKEYVQTMANFAKNNAGSEWTVGKNSHVRISVGNTELDIKAGIAQTLGILRSLHERAVVELLSIHSENSLVLSFDFPPQVKIPCEQYLLYFVQFLSDLGIEATADIQHQAAGNLLFSIKPTDRDEALGNIRRALEIYLQLPETKDTSNIDNRDDPRVQSLIAEIHNLHGKLALRAAELQYKDATIGVLQQSSELQRKLLSGEVILDSLKYVGSNKDVKDKEEFLGGIFALTELEGKGYKVNLPKIYRMLKDQVIRDSEDIE